MENKSVSKFQIYLIIVVAFVALANIALLAFGSCMGGDCDCECGCDGSENCVCIEQKAEYESRIAELEAQLKQATTTEPAGIGEWSEGWN